MIHTLNNGKSGLVGHSFAYHDPKPGLCIRFLSEDASLEKGVTIEVRGEPSPEVVIEATLRMVEHHRNIVTMIDPEATEPRYGNVRFKIKQCER